VSSGAPGRGLRWTAGLVDLVLPAACASCGAATAPDGPPVCALCRARLPAVPHPHCPRCGYTRLPGLAGAGGCGECASWPDELSRAAAPYLHECPADRLVHGLKYRGVTALAPWMGAQMERAARGLAAGTRPVLVPVPIARSRLRERGYNQALLLARGLSRVTGWPVSEVLRRGRAAPAQAGGGRVARARNVVGAFETVGPTPAAAGALLVDDVLTTAATAGACARALRLGGVACLGVVCFARTPPPEPGT
jgi:predicted amidophosphoribosyltransferase